MKVISKSNKVILNILGAFKNNRECSRLLQYCIHHPYDGGHLLYNILTREMVYLTESEYDNIFINEYLQKHWFIVPEDVNDKEYADVVKAFLQNSRAKRNHIKTYTIFTTTDCNARCFYCFEHGRERFPMSIETASKVVDYIVAHCGDHKVTIHWFGGEPLLNTDVIDYISDSLTNLGISFTSKITTNGFLFDDNLISNARLKWNLKKAQITLDGTEAVYNKVKAYVSSDLNPFQTVLSNISDLLDASIDVSIRLNMDMYNIDDLLALVDQLGERFFGKKGLSVYAHHLFDIKSSMALLHSKDAWDLRENAMERLEASLLKYGLISRKGITPNFKLNHCMADSTSAITISPDGKIGLCEVIDSGYIGHIDCDEFNQDMVDSWRERIPEIPECTSCFYYPECIKIKKCPNSNICYSQFRDSRLRNILRNMEYEYNRRISLENDYSEMCDTL